MITFGNMMDLKRTAWDLRGLSTDTKPTNLTGYGDVPNGSTFLEIDTGDIYAYDADGESWNKL